MNRFASALLYGPERPDAYWGMAVAAHVADMPYDIPDLCFARAHNMQPDNSPLYADQGMVLEGRGDLDQAIALLNKAVALAPKNAKAHGSLSRIYSKQGNVQKTGEHLTNVRLNAR